MSGYAYGIVSVEDYIDCGLRLQLSASRTLALYRETGGAIRTKEFYARWNMRVTLTDGPHSVRRARYGDA